MIHEHKPSCDISSTAIERALADLPAAKVFRLQCHPTMLAEANAIAKDLTPTAGPIWYPVINIELCPAMFECGWALWSGEHCVFSKGA